MQIYGDTDDGVGACSQCECNNNNNNNTWGVDWDVTVQTPLARTHTRTDRVLTNGPRERPISSLRCRTHMSLSLHYSHFLSCLQPQGADLLTVSRLGRVRPPGAVNKEISALHILVILLKTVSRAPTDRRRSFLGRLSALTRLSSRAVPQGWLHKSRRVPLHASQSWNLHLAPRCVRPKTQPGFINPWKPEPGSRTDSRRVLLIIRWRGSESFEQSPLRLGALNPQRKSLPRPENAKKMGSGELREWESGLKTDRNVPRWSWRAFTRVFTQRFCPSLWDGLRGRERVLRTAATTTMVWERPGELQQEEEENEEEGGREGVRGGVRFCRTPTQKHLPPAELANKLQESEPVRPLRAECWNQESTKNDLPSVLKHINHAFYVAWWFFVDCDPCKQGMKLSFRTCL